MKKVLRSFFVFLLVVFSVPVAFSQLEEYEYKFIVDHDFDDDDKIKCDISIDGEEDVDSFKFDEKDKGSDLEEKGDFYEKVKFDCDEDVDEITLQVYDSEGVKLYDEDFKKKDKVDVKIKDVKYDEDEIWFEIEVEHKFGSKDVDCDLEVDSTKYEFTFDKEDDSEGLTIQKNFEKKIKFSCDDKLDEIKLKVYDDDNDLEYSKTFEEDDKISYDQEVQDKEEYEIVVDIEHDFGNDDVKCDVVIDEDEEKEFKFDEDSSASDLRVSFAVREKLEFDCNEDFDEMKVFVRDENGDKVETLEFSDEDKFEYEIKEGTYDFQVVISHEFKKDEEVECEFYADGNKKVENKLDDGSLLKDFRVEGGFEKDFEMKCDGELNKVEFYTYFAGESKSLFEKEFENVKFFSHVQKSKAEMDKDEKERLERERLEKIRLEEEALAKKKAEEEVLAKKKLEEEALAKKKAEEEARKLQEQKASLDENLNGGVVKNDSVKLNSSSGFVDGLGDIFDSRIWLYVVLVLVVGVLGLAVYKLNSQSVENSVRKKNRFGEVRYVKKPVQKTSSQVKREGRKVDFSFLDKKER